MIYMLILLFLVFDRAMDDLSDEELQNTDIVDTAINSLQDEIDHRHRSANSTDVHFIEGILDAVISCQRVSYVKMITI